MGAVNGDVVLVVVRNIGELVAVRPGPVPGRTMGDVRCIESAAVVVDGDRIAWFGPEAELDAPTDGEVVDAVPQRVATRCNTGLG